MVNSQYNHNQDNDKSDFDLNGENYDDNSLIVDVDGFEGPMHLLLELARNQKVDLARISILNLVDQYLLFVTKAKKEHIEIAADYLVMASWLAYLKSRLLLPKKKPEAGETAPEILSSHLAWRLKRLEAMRKAGEGIFNLPQTNNDVFTRPFNQLEISAGKLVYKADLFDLIKSYCRQRNKTAKKVHHVRKWPVYSLEEARKQFKKSLPKDNDWHKIAGFAPKNIKAEKDAPSFASFYAGLLLASLEMTKHGVVNIKQKQLFDDVFVQNCHSEQLNFDDNNNDK